MREVYGHVPGTTAAAHGPVSPPSLVLSQPLNTCMLVCPVGVPCYWRRHIQDHGATPLFRMPATSKAIALSLIITAPLHKLQD